MLIFFLAIFGIVSPRFLWRNIRYAILAVFLVAAIICPMPDPVEHVHLRDAAAGAISDWHWRGLVGASLAAEEEGGGVTSLFLHLKNREWTRAWTGRSTLQPARRPALQFDHSWAGERCLGAKFWTPFAFVLLMLSPLGIAAQTHFNGAKALEYARAVCGHRSALAHQPKSSEGRSLSAQPLPARPA